MRQPVATPGHFGRYLGTLLEAHKLSVTRLAEASRLEPNFVLELLSGKQILTADVAFLLAEAFGQSPLALLEVQRSGVLENREPRKLAQVAA